MTNIIDKIKIYLRNDLTLETYCHNSIHELETIGYIDSYNTLKKRIDLQNKLIQEFELKEINDKILKSGYSDSKIEIVESIYYLEYLTGIYNHNNKLIINKIETDLESLEKLYIRILLLINRWSIQSIEKVINRYYKTPLVKDLKTSYIFLKNILLLKESALTKGRPKLPVEVREIIINHNRRKNRLKINEKYACFKDINGLFEKNEIDSIINLINSSNINNKIQLINKANVLLKYSKNN